MLRVAPMPGPGVTFGPGLCPWRGRGPPLPRRTRLRILIRWMMGFPTGELEVRATVGLVTPTLLFVRHPGGRPSPRATRRSLGRLLLFRLDPAPPAGGGLSPSLPRGSRLTPLPFGTWAAGASGRSALFSGSSVGLWFCVIF